MKTLKEYFLESREDGKYLDLPPYMSEPWLYPHMPEEDRIKRKSEYKAYKDSIKKVNAENLEILLDKFLEAIETRECKNNFMLNSSNCKLNVYLNNGEKYADLFDSIESHVAVARVALESD